MPPVGIRTHNLSTRAAADLRLRPRGHWDRQMSRLFIIIIINIIILDFKLSPCSECSMLSSG